MGNHFYIKTNKSGDFLGFNISAVSVYVSNGWKLQQQRSEWTAEWAAQHVSSKHMRALNKQNEQTKVVSAERHP